MGMYDSVMVNCPKCGEEHEFQSKSGECLLDVYTLENCPDDVMVNVNRHSPCKCNCGFNYEVDIENRKAVMATDDFKTEAISDRFLTARKQASNGGRQPPATN